MRVMELAEAVGAEKRALDALIRRISTEQFRQPVTGEQGLPYEGETRRLGSEWTVKDVLGHIAAYAEAERRALAAGVGRAREEAVYFDRIQPWNEQQYELRRERTPGRIVAEVQETTARYLSLIKSLHEEDLIKTIRFPWNEQGTVHELIVDGLKHQREHREELAAALG